MKTCQNCGNDEEANECKKKHIRWKNGFTLKFKTPKYCPDWKKNGGK